MQGICSHRNQILVQSCNHSPNAMLVYMTFDQEWLQKYNIFLIEIVGGRTPAACLSYKLTCEPLAQKGDLECRSMRNKA